MQRNGGEREENWWDNVRRARVMARLQSDRWVTPSKSEAGLVRAVIEAYEAELADELNRMLKVIDDSSGSERNAIRVGQLRGLIAGLGLEDA